MECDVVILCFGDVSNNVSNNVSTYIIHTNNVIIIPL